MNLTVAKLLFAIFFLTLGAWGGVWGVGLMWRELAPFRPEADRLGRPLPTLFVREGPLTEGTVVRSGFSDVVERVAPSVVNVFASARADRVGRRNPLFNHRAPLPGPFSENSAPSSDSPPMWGRQRPDENVGSGVIVSPEGFILTNHHVVEGAEEIRVALAGGRGEYKAAVVGVDPQTDIALLRVEARGLPAITLADSGGLRVGDVVLAVGNPFGVGQTVTMGIVSAVGRGGFGILEYEDFIQTDASINPGNSGGALTDAEGRLVGINTAIMSPSGGNQGIGFSVPINLARHVMEQLLRDGKVARGYVGVMIQPLTPDLARLFDLPSAEGAFVDSVSEGSPAAQAGMLPGDVIVSFDGVKIRESRQFRLLAAQTAPGTSVVIGVIRAGGARALTVKMARLETEGGARTGWKGWFFPKSSSGGSDAGGQG